MCVLKKSKCLSRQGTCLIVEDAVASIVARRTQPFQVAQTFLTHTFVRAMVRLRGQLCTTIFTTMIGTLENCLPACRPLITAKILVVPVPKRTRTSPVIVC